MGTTSIEWTEKTWNPLRGCSRISEGCRNCYAERVAARFSFDDGGPSDWDPRFPDRKPGAFHGFAERTPSGPRWTGKVALVPEHLGDPLRWRKPTRVFVNSMSDLFHEALSWERDIERVFAVMASPGAAHHTFQVLTKRATNMREFVEDWMRRTQSAMPPNVHLGVSVEDQATADARIPELLATPAAVRWVSYEPALAAVDFDLPRCDTCGEPSDCVGDDGATPFCNEHERECNYGHWLDPLNGGLQWIVIGGESGPGARPFDLAWTRSTIRQCREAGVPVFVKQLGADPHLDGAQFPAERRMGGWDRKGGDPFFWPEDLRVREYPEAIRG